MTPEELRRAVARAIYLHTYAREGGVWEAVDPRYQDNVWGAKADAALAVVREAMREPSAEMRIGAYSQSNLDGPAVCDVWAAMLAASPLREPGE